MTSETPAADPAVIERYRGELARVDELTGAGDYEAAIALLQNVARSSGDEALMQRLIELRVVAMPLLADNIDPQPMYEANQLLGEPGAVRERLDKDGQKYIQQVVGSLLYYARAVDITILLALNKIAS